MKLSKYRIQANRTKPHIALHKYPHEAAAIWSWAIPSITAGYGLETKTRIHAAEQFAVRRNHIEGRYVANAGAHNNERKDIVNLALMRAG